MRLSRFRLRVDARLCPRETVATFGRGTFPDSLTLDEAGGAWITSVVSNRVLRVTPDGATHLVLEDAHPGTSTPSSARFSATRWLSLIWTHH